MQTYRILSKVLALCMTVGLALPLTALATPPSPIPTQMVEGSGTAQSQLLDGLTIQAKAAILLDDNTGEILYQYNIHEKRYPASITKVMTALLTMEAMDRGELSKDDIIVVGDDINHEVGADSSTQNIKHGEEMRLEDLLYCALTASANEACNALAQVVSGSVEQFLLLMNQRAQELGMTGTNFENTHGYHNDTHYTTAYDIALMCSAAMDRELFRTIVTTKDYLVPATNLSPERHLRETNGFISSYRVAGYLYPSATGIKTGSTSHAGLCLASSASENGRDLIAVVLGCERVPGTTGSEGFTQFTESRKLLEWGFNSTSKQAILDSTSYYYEVPVTLSDQVNYVGIQPQGSLEATLPDDIDPDDFKKEIILSQSSVEAPVSKGQVIGAITVSNDGIEYGTLDLVAVADIQRSEFLYALQQIEMFFDQLWVRIVLGVLLVLVAVLLLRWLVFGKRRRSRSRQRRSGYTGHKR